MTIKLKDIDEETLENIHSKFKNGDRNTVRLFANINFNYHFCKYVEYGDAVKSFWLSNYTPCGSHFGKSFWYKGIEVIFAEESETNRFECDGEILEII